MNPLAESMTWGPVTVEGERAGPEVFRVGPTLIYRQTGRVESPAGERWLRNKELELILHLYEHVTITFTREELLQTVWHYQPDLRTRTVDQTVATLRKKIEIDPEQPRFLQTVYGLGYKLVI